MLNCFIILIYFRFFLLVVIWLQLIVLTFNFYLIRHIHCFHSVYACHVCVIMYIFVFLITVNFISLHCFFFSFFYIERKQLYCKRKVVKQRSNTLKIVAVVVVVVTCSTIVAWQIAMTNSGTWLSKPRQPFIRSSSPFY